MGMRDPLGEAVSRYIHHRDRTAWSKDPGKHPPPAKGSLAGCGAGPSAVSQWALTWPAPGHVI